MPVVELIKGIVELAILVFGEWAANRKATREKQEAILRMDQLGNLAVKKMRAKFVAENQSIQANESRLEQLRRERGEKP